MQKINVSEKMREFMLLMENFNGLEFNMKEECEEDWTENYAIALGLDPDVDLDYDIPYIEFDEEQMWDDIVEKIKEVFGVTEVFGVGIYRAGVPKGATGLIVSLYKNCGEIEVYYAD